MNLIFSFVRGLGGRVFRRLALPASVLLCAGHLAGQPVATDWTNKPFAEIKVAAEKGDASAMRMVANAYLTGEGTQQNAVEAARWLNRAAERKDVLAQFVLGILYDEGKGVQRDMVEAVRWYRQAAEAGLPDAQFNLGVCYTKGDGVTKDQTEAIRWFNKAAEQGDAQAQLRLGLIYQNGDGVEQNSALASKWFRLSAYQNDVTAQYLLGICYRDGTGVVMDPVDAVKWFRKAADQGHPKAQYQLGLAYDNGVGVARDRREATALFQKAAAQGHADAQRLLAGDTSPAVPRTSTSPADTTGSGKSGQTFTAAPATNPGTATGAKNEPPPFFSGPAGRELPPAATTPNSEAATNTPNKNESPSFFSGPADKTGTPGGTIQLLPSTNPTKDETSTTQIAPTPSGADSGTMIRPRDTGADNRRPPGEEYLRQPAPQPSNDLVSPTTLAVMTLGTAVVMMLILGYMVLFFKARIGSLENEIKKTQFELSKANVNLTAMLHQVEALQLADRSGERPERKQVGGSWKELPAEAKGDTSFRSRRSAA